MTKTYQAIKFTSLHLTILVTRKKNDKPEKMNLDFIGGSNYPLQSNGTFTTNDKDVQAQLEKNKGFNKDYRILFENGKPVYEAPENLTVEDKLKASDKLNTVLTQQINDLINGDENPLTETVEELEKELEEKEEVILDLQKKLNEKPVGEVVKPKEVKETKPTEKLVPGVLNMQAARQHLIKECGQDIKTMKNGAEVLLIAKGLGIVFPDWHPKS